MFNVLPRATNPVSAAGGRAPGRLQELLVTGKALTAAPSNAATTAQERGSLNHLFPSASHR